MKRANKEKKGYIKMNLILRLFGIAVKVKVVKTKYKLWARPDDGFIWLCESKPERIGESNTWHLEKPVLLLSPSESKKFEIHDIKEPVEVEIIVKS